MLFVSQQLAIDIRTETKDQVKLIGDSVSCHINYHIVRNLATTSFERIEGFVLGFYSDYIQTKFSFHN